MHVTDIHKVKSQLSKLVELAFAGEEAMICKAGKPMAMLVKYQIRRSRRYPVTGKVKSRFFMILAIFLKNMIAVSGGNT